jgi:hypothetical protein
MSRLDWSRARASSSRFKNDYETRTGKQQLASKREHYRGLLALAHERGYKPGWAAIQYKEVYGEWPPREWQPDA